MGPEGVLVAEQFVAVGTFGLLLSRVPDLQVLLQVGSVADELVTHRAGSRLVRVVLCHKANNDRPISFFLKLP